MIRSPINVVVAALLMLGATSARAEMLHVDITSYNTLYTGIFGGISFDLNTSATLDTLGTEGCFLGCIPPDTYSTFSATGGMSNASLIWNNVDYGLQSSSIFLDRQGSYVYELDMNLTFNNGMVFNVVDQPSAGPYPDFNDNQSQLLARAMLASFNGDIYAGFISDNGAETGITGFVAKTTPVPEPGTFALFAASLAGIALARWRARERWAVTSRHRRQGDTL